MAVTVGELRERLKDVPDSARVYWYTGQALGRFRTRLQVEWMDDKDNPHSDEIASWNGEISQGGHVE